MIMRRGYGKSAGALQRYQENPRKTFASHLADVVLTEPRDIDKTRMNMFTEIYRQVERPDVRNIDEKTLLAQKEALGVLTSEEQSKLDLSRRVRKH